MTAFNLMPYQQALWDRLANGGFKRGEMSIISSGRQSGKSHLNLLYGKNLCQEIILPTQAVIKPKYSFSRKWHEVHLMFKSWDPVQERIDWCEQTFGAQPSNPDAWSRWYTSFTTLRFRDEKDYQWFILRWGT